MTLDRTRMRGMHKDLLPLAKELDELGFQAKYLRTGIRFSDPLAPDRPPLFLPLKKTINSSIIHTLQQRVRQIHEERSFIERAARPEAVIDMLNDSISPADQVLARKVAGELTEKEMQKMDRSESPAQTAAQILKSRKRTEISRVPYMAARRPGRNGAAGKRYASETIEVITYSDGSQEYGCAFRGCAFTSDNHRSVSSHYAGSHSKDKPAHVGPEVRDETYLEPITTRNYRPTERLVATLGAEIKRALAAGLNAYEISERLLVWFHERPDLEPRDHESRELTPEQILDRIRTLVDTGTMSRMREENEALRLQLAEANSHLEREREARRAVAELLLEDSN